MKLATAIEGVTLLASFSCGSGGSASTEQYGSNSRIIKAVQQADLDQVKAFLEAGDDPNVEGFLGSSALTVAAERNLPEIARVLLDGGASPNGPKPGRETPLMISSRDGHMQVVEILLSHGADPNLGDQPDAGIHGTTALMLACIFGRSAVVDALLESKARVDLRDSNGMTAAELALANKHWDIAEKLRRAGAEVSDSMIVTARFYEATQKGDVAGVREALAKGANVEVTPWSEDTPLMVAVREGKVDVVTLLLDSGAKVNAVNPRLKWTPLMVLAGPQTMHVSDADMAAIARILLEHGATVGMQDGFGKTMLHYAILTGKSCLIPILIRSGVNLNAADVDGETALMHAVAIGPEEDLQAILDAGADVHATNPDGGSILHYACRGGGEPGKVSLLIKAGADVNARDRSGKSPLDYARLADDEKVVRILVAAGAK